MAQMMRRVLMISAGVAALTTGLATPRSAGAYGLIDSPEMERRCYAVGGQPSDDSDGKTWCDTPQMDERCNDMIEPEYDRDGNRIRWVYNIETERCEKVGDCFLTTACVTRAGLADDCFELASLRRFRDTVLMHLPGGRDDIALYYRVAPAIVAAIAASPDRARELARLYVLYILPSALAARLGWTRLARGLYTRMMRGLMARYRLAAV